LSSGPDTHHAGFNVCGFTDKLAEMRAQLEQYRGEVTHVVIIT